MKRKILGIVLAGAVALALSACSSEGETSTPDTTTTSSTTGTTQATEPAEEAVQGTFREAYVGDREQGPEWFYMYDNDGTGWRELVTAESLAEFNPDAGYDGYGDNWRLPYEEGDGKDDGNNADYTSFTEWDGVKADFSGNNGQTKLAVVYEAQADGTLKIGPWQYGAYNVDEEYNFIELDQYSPNVTVQILHNDEELYSAESKTMDGQSSSMTVEVKAGDKIYFVASSGGNAMETLVSFDTIDVTVA
ncbi:MAG TPA: hypothetical protein H9684_07100 [Firmicutes bacterium]|nr:hypothetical protein [Bacillota bacterium]